MTEPKPGRTRRKTFWWVIGITVAAAVVAVLVVVGLLSSALSSEQEPPVNPDHAKALDDELRSKGSAEEALTRYESIVQSTADDITAVMPELAWKWNRDPDFLDCTGEFAGTSGVRVGTRNLLANGPIADDAWPTALQIVRDHAAELGAVREHVYADKAGHHDIAFYADNGVEIRLLTRGRAVLSAMTDCHLQRRDLSPGT